MQEVFSNVLFQVCLFIGLVYIMGFIISLINRLFYNFTGGGRGICLATGLIGTPIHELSHAVMCIVFGHKIEEMKLFQTDDENGVLGYVYHSYNRRNIYHVIGNYFIGIAPIVVGALVLYLIMKGLIPNAYSEISSNIQSLIVLQSNGIDSDIFSYVFDVCIGAFVSIFTTDFGFKTIIFLILCLCISLHMNLSGADVKGSLTAIPLIAILLFIVNFALYLISASTYAVFLEAVTVAGCYLIAILTISLIFSLVLLAIGLVFKIIFRR